MTLATDFVVIARTECTGAGISPNPGGNPIDEALAPACSLDHQNAATGTEDRLDGLSLARTNRSAVPEGCLRMAAGGHR